MDQSVNTSRNHPLHSEDIAPAQLLKVRDPANPRPALVYAYDLSSLPANKSFSPSSTKSKLSPVSWKI